MGSHLISPKWVIHKVQFRQKKPGLYLPHLVSEGYLNHPGSSILLIDLIEKDTY